MRNSSNTKDQVINLVIFLSLFHRDVVVNAVFFEVGVC